MVPLWITALLCRHHPPVFLLLLYDSHVFVNWMEGFTWNETTNWHKPKLSLDHVMDVSTETNKSQGPDASWHLVTRRDTALEKGKNRRWGRGSPRLSSLLLSQATYLSEVNPSDMPINISELSFTLCLVSMNGCMAGQGCYTSSL